MIAGLSDIACLLPDKKEGLGNNTHDKLLLMIVVRTELYKSKLMLIQITMLCYVLKFNIH